MKKVEMGREKRAGSREQGAGSGERGEGREGGLGQRSEIRGRRSLDVLFHVERGPGCGL